MTEKTKKGSPHKDPEKKSKSLMIASLGRILTGAPSDADVAKIKKITDALKNVKGIPSDFDVKMLKNTLPTKKDGGMVKKYMGGGSVHKKKNKMATTKGWGASRKT